MALGKRAVALLAAVWVSSAAAVDTVTLDIQPSSTWQLTLGVGGATDTDTQSVEGTITLRLDDVTNPGRISFDGQNTHFGPTGNFEFLVDLGLLGQLQSQILDSAGTIVSPVADGNSDGLADGADFTIWADNFGGGGNFTQGEWSGDGTVDGADFTVWADNFGIPSGLVSGGQYDLSQHLGVVNEGTSPYMGTGFLSGLSGTLDFVADPVLIEAPLGQMGAISSTPTGNPNEYLVTLTVPWNLVSTLDEDLGVTLETVTMITASGLFVNNVVVPEPGAWALLAIGSLGLWGLRRRAQ